MGGRMDLISGGRRAALGAGLAAFVACAPVMVQAAQAAPPEAVARGHDLVRRNCGVCHAIGTKDASPNRLAPPFRTLHERYPIDDLAEALAEGILTGHPQMPEFSFPPEEVNAIIEYLKSIQTQTGAERGPAEVGRKAG